MGLSEFGFQAEAGQTKGFLRGGELFLNLQHLERGHTALGYS